MLMLTEEQMELIKSHGCEGYPHEVCGIFLGTCEGDDKKLVEVRRAKNLNTERAHDRYKMDDEDLKIAEKEGRERGLDIIGFYHSHPDHPDVPSEHDRELALNAYAYVYSFLIASVKEGNKVSMKSWVLSEESNQFNEEKIAISGE